MSEFETLDSGVRSQYASGMVRDTEEGKARFALLLPKGVPYADQMLTRFAELMARGAAKYEDRNWELAEGEAELERYHSSALRHLIQWVTGEVNEDHAAAVMFNILAGETVKWKMQRPDRECVTTEDGACVSGSCLLHDLPDPRDWFDPDVDSEAELKECCSNDDPTSWCTGTMCSPECRCAIKAAKGARAAD